jgi:magnesium transporter
VAESFENKSMAHENREGFDLLSVNILNRRSMARANRVCICLGKDFKLFFCEDADAAVRMMYPEGCEGTGIEYNRLLCVFFERLTADDPDVLERIENETAALESALMTSKKRNFVNEIISLRKKLMVYKRYYEQLLDILDDLQENENRILDPNSLRHFKTYSRKVDRLYQSVLHLRENVTQAREAYQAEVDISLNNIMKLFTVITAVFLPLTLIVGWYGMNLQMPEFGWPLGYPMVIILCVAVVVLCLVYFKKHKWF